MSRPAFRLLTAAALAAAFLAALPVFAADKSPQKPRVESATNGYGSNWWTTGIAADRREEGDGNLTGALLEFGNWMDSESKYMTLAVLGFLEYRSGGPQDYGAVGINGSFLLRGGPFRIGPRLGLRVRYRDSDPDGGWGVSAGPGLETGFLIKQRVYLGVFWEREFDTSVPSGNLYGVSLRWNFEKL